MSGRIRGLAWLAPIVCASLLHGGCEMFQHGAAVAKAPAAAEATAEHPVAPAQPTPGGVEQVKHDPPAAKEDGTAPPAAPGTKPDAAPMARTAYTPQEGQPHPEGVQQVSAVAPQPGCADSAPCNPHQRVTPTAAGCLLNLAPGESPIERLLEEKAKNAALEANLRNLELRSFQLTTALDQRERALQLSAAEVQAAVGEVQQSRAAFDALHREVETLRASITRREKEEIETIKAINKMLDRMNGERIRPDPEQVPAPR